MAEIVIRPAIADDRPAMLEITRTIWEGNDYLPRVWNRWLSDPHGLLMVAEIQGRVAGLQHIAVMPDGSAWLEGIRVAEDMRGRGVARAMLEYALGWASAARLVAVRLATSSANEATARLASGAGMSVLGEYIPYSAAPLEEDLGSAVRVAPTSRFAEVWDFIATRNTAPSDGFYTEGWTAYALDERRLRLLLSVGAVLLYGHAPLQGLAIGTSSVDRPVLRPGLILGTPEACTALAADLRHRAAAARLAGVRGPVAGDVSADAMQNAGYTANREHTMVLWGVPLTPEAAAR